MTSEGGYWAQSGRHRPDRDPGDEDDYDQRPGYNGRAGGYADGADGDGAGGYGPQGDDEAHDGYGRPGGYEEVPGYGGPDGYGRSASYGESAGYGDPGYGDPGGYGGRADYGAPGSYGDRADYGTSASYRAPGGYEGADGYGDPGYRDPGGYGDQADYGAGPTGRGRHSAGQASGMPDPGSTDPYGDAVYGEDFRRDPYGPGSYQEPAYGSPEVYEQPGGPGSYDPNAAYGRGGSHRHAALGPGQDPDPTSSHQWSDQYAEPGLPLDSGPLSRPETDTGAHSGWAFTPETDPYAAAAAGGPDTGSFPGPDTGAFGRDESGTFARPDTGSYGRADSGSFARPDTGSYRRDDSVAFRRLDPGSFGPDDEDEAGGPRDPRNHDTGTIRWTSGPPPARPRLDRNEEDIPGHGDLPGDQDGYAEWHDDLADDDWQDEANGGLLSRRFGRGGGGDSGGGGSRSRARGRKRRRIRGKAAFTVAIFVVILVVGIVAAIGYSYVNRWITDRYGDYAGAGSGRVQVTVQEGADLAQLGPTLLSKGVIMALRPYDTAAAAATGTLQPGVYLLHHHMNAAIAVQYLLSSKARLADKVTIIEGTRASAIAAQFAKRTGYKASEFMQIIDHPPASLGLPSWAAGSTAEGFLFPDTYTLLPHETPLQILKTMVTEFNQKVTSLNLVGEAVKVNTTPWHVLIVASMVQAESGSASDFGKVARVAWNRLGQGMALHFDSTVFYGLNTYGTAATSAQVKKDTPYNTYIHTGLPPGPIGNPGLAAIQAALHPTHGTWLYFITDLRHKPYVTHFTSSYNTFKQWKQQFQS